MKKILLLSSFLPFALYAQVGINTSTPNSTLDVVGNGSSTSAKDGITVPRITKQQLASKVAGTYATGQVGALVYVTSVTAPTGITPSLSQVSQVNGNGFYTFDGTSWQPYANIYNADGTLTGNRTVTQAGNTLAFNSTATNAFSIDGTTFSVDAANHRLGLGTATPATRLHVVATTDNFNRYNLFDATAGTNQYGIIALRNTSALATGNYSLLGFTNSGPASGGANWAIGSIRTGATATNGGEEDFYVGNSTGGGLSERLRIKPNTGYVGIGTSNPTARVEIASGATDVSGLKFTNINSATPPTSNTSPLGIDASGNVVVQSSLTTSFRSFSIDANSATNSLITIGGIQLRYPTTTCASVNSFVQIRSTTGANNIGILHAATTSSQTAASNAFVATTPLTVTTTFADMANLPVNCVQDGAATFSFFSYTDRTYYRISFHIADGDSLGFGALGYIFAELQK